LEEEEGLEVFIGDTAFDMWGNEYDSGKAILTRPREE